METKTCPYCAEEIKIEAIKCKHCGEFLNNESSPKQGPDTWICKKCKEEVENTFDICWNCGARMEGTIDREADSEFKEIKKEVGNQYSSGSGNIILMMVVFAFVGFGFGYYMYGNAFGNYLDIKVIFFGSGIEGMIASSIREKIVISTIIGIIIGGVIGNYLNKRQKE